MIFVLLFVIFVVQILILLTLLFLRKIFFDKQNLIILHFYSVLKQ